MNNFDESKHPRDADGKFTDKNSSQTSATATKLMKPIDSKTSESQPKGAITSSGNPKNLIKTNNKLSFKELGKLSFEEQLDEFAKGNIPEGFHLSLGKVPNVYKQVGSKGQYININPSLFPKITGKGIYDHDISIDELKQLPIKLGDPLYIFKSKKNSIVSVVDMVDNQGRQIIVPIYMNEKQGKIYVDRISSVYGRNNFNQYVSEQSKLGNLLYEKK